MMTIAILLGLSLVWGGLVICVGAGLQRAGLSGAMRQMMWRMAALMLAAPFAAAGVMAVLGPEIVEPIWTWGEGGAADVPVVVDPALLERAAAAPSVERNGRITPDMSTFELVLALIGLGWFVRAVLARRAAKELEMVTREAAPVRSQSVLKSAEGWARRLRLSRTPRLKLMPGDFSPFTQGVVRPTIYLPHGLEAKLSKPEMDLVIGHELMHVKRGDAMWRPVERLVADLLWFNPFAWFVRAELERARELACDEAMLKAQAPAKDYARALVSVARFAAGLPDRAPAAAMFPFNKDKALPERVKAAATGAGKSSKLALAGMAAFVLAGLPLAVAQGAGAPKQRLPIPEFTATVVTSPKAEISSHYGERNDPFTGKAAWHKGTDVKAPLGTPIYAPADAEVVAAGRRAAYGEAVELRFNREWFGLFGQMSEIKVQEGQRVRAGDLIGLVGETGRATGAHVHIEIHGPGANYDRNGEMAAFNPVHLGLAPSLDEELNAAQIRKLGVVLPEPAPAAAIAPPPTAPGAAPPIPPAPPEIVFFDAEAFKDLEPGSVLEFTQDDGSHIKIVRSEDGKSTVKTIKRKDKIVSSKDLSEDERAALMDKLESEHRVIIRSEGDLTELDGDFDVAFASEDASHIFITRDEKGDRTVEKVHTIIRTDHDLSEEEIEALREEARAQAEEARERAAEAREHAAEMREAAAEAREEARLEAQEARREAAEAKREAEEARREMEEALREQSYHLDGGFEDELFQSLDLESIISDGIELGFREAALVMDDFVAEGGFDIETEALSEAIADIDAELADLRIEMAAIEPVDFESRIEKRAMASAVKALELSQKALMRQRDETKTQRDTRAE